MSSQQREPRSFDSTPSTSSIRDSVRFWRGVVGYRQADYRADVPEPVSGLTMDQTQVFNNSTGAGAGSLRNRNNNISAISNQNVVPGMSMISTTSTQPPATTAATRPSSGNPRRTVWARLKHAGERNRLLTNVLNSPTWKTLLISCSTVILFGAQIRDMFIPKSGDLAVDIVFMIVFIFLVVDIVLRCDTEPHYFVCYSCRGWNKGSFLFWCDFLSTITLLFDVRWLTERLGVKEAAIELDMRGIPVSGLDSFNRYIPVEFEPNMIVLIVQTLRVARFIRSSRAVKISANVGSFLGGLLFCGQNKQRQRSSNVLVGSSSTSARNRRSGWRPPRWMMMWGQPKQTEEFRRQVAATKIQRAWRAARQADMSNEMNNSTEFDVGWKPPSTRRRPHLTYDMYNTNNRSIQSANVAPPPTALPTKRGNESQVGSAMRELTGQRVAVGIILALLLTVLFTYVEEDATRPFTMIVLHNQTANPDFADKSLDAAKRSSVPDMFRYESSDGSVLRDFSIPYRTPEQLRVREVLRIIVRGGDRETTGYFSYRAERFDEAFVGLLATIFILFVWFFGVTGFAGPVMVLVVVPIERMVRLLGMLMRDPLGYQSTSRYKRFVDEEDELTKNTRWTKEILKGMETSFLMSTILRIGSLMKVGFGSAGVEIIRNNLEPGQSQNTLILSSQGSTVSCIFLFCDIRNFTDATECLQEEVFVFTNRIAAVVHSFCHAYGGSANKNVGDAFLISWQLEEESISVDNHDSFSWSHHQGSVVKMDGFVAKNNQADKALLSVVKICMSLYNDDYFIEALSEAARDSLVNKLQQRKGPVVQMGFGMHAGRAVQGAIGSQRKIDATYVSEAVERAEFLESSTKKYGLKLLMSDSFHRLLNPSNRRRCRKIDQIVIREDEDGEDEIDLNCETMELFTFDMDIEALSYKQEAGLREASDTASDAGSKRGSLAKRGGKRLSMRLGKSTRGGVDDSSVDDFDPSTYLTVPAVMEEHGTSKVKLVLPTGPALYNPNVWTSEDMKTVRELYSDGLFFQKFMSGLQSFYAKDWGNAKQCFSVILDRFEDGPSRYFVREIERHNGKPPRDFLGYGMA